MMNMQPTTEVSICINRLEARRAMDGDYIYVSGTASFDVVIEGKRLQVTLQSGHSYYHDDYNAPSNDLDFYSEQTTPLIVELFEKDVDKEYLLSELRKVAQHADIDDLLNLQADLYGVLEFAQDKYDAEVKRIKAALYARLGLVDDEDFIRAYRAYGDSDPAYGDVLGL